MMRSLSVVSNSFFWQDFSCRIWGFCPSFLLFATGLGQVCWYLWPWLSFGWGTDIQWTVGVVLLLGLTQLLRPTFQEVMAFAWIPQALSTTLVNIEALLWCYSSSWVIISTIVPMCCPWIAKDYWVFIRPLRSRWCSLRRLPWVNFYAQFDTTDFSAGCKRPPGIMNWTMSPS